ncbi:PREDICTED: LOW QUALITY PROTEIN: dnaJ homolog subfamily B member 8 [Acanthisitta chloris]|uniref:LOW QUALITY PROTEIN: dnaJ homolog subfamily B member 8 n=1 Tax=Acanthisitta chloris TaxID=57068 RepID=UPI0004F0D979|nr:PREDICTED: LOW QUALITY PROTEIN: dnaJ homolog subfamily B member 8 [Acanthisitta chloris]
MEYYKVLRLKKNASQNDINKSYHKIAQKWHPDKNPSNKKEAEKKFKEIVEAYNVLSDPQKQSLYDGSVQESSVHRERDAMGYNGFFDSCHVFHNQEQVFGRVDPFAYDSWNRRINDENWPSGRGGSSSLFSTFRESFMPWNSFCPSEQFTFFAGNTAGPYHVRTVLTTTEVINGKMITTQKIIENGQEQKEVEEDGQLKSVIINEQDYLN